MIGSVQAHRLEQGRLLIDTEEAHIRISQYNESTFRIQVIQLNSAFQEHTYACPSLPVPHTVVVQALSDTLRVDTAHVRLNIQMAPLRMRFETREGQVLSQDDPGLGICWDGTEVTNYRSLQPGERFFGLGERTGPLDKAGKQFRNWNTDAFGYHGGTDPLYVSCPFFIGLSHEQPYGIFLNNHSETTFNFGAANDRFSFFQAASGELDYFFFAGPKPADILRDYTALTGRTSLPSLWSLGFQQCRYSYYPDSEILRVAQTFRELNIPADVIYFDIHYMQDFKVFTWHNEHFPDPSRLIKELKKMGFRVVVILDPGIKVEPGYRIYDEGQDADVFVKYPDNQPYKGAAWPGWCQFPDFTEERVRTWWGQYVAELVQMGVDGFWNDMNEPAVWGHHTPGIVRFGLDGKKGSHKEAHNVYGMQMARATAEGAAGALDNQRSFILTRATFSGGQRDSALWTGDNQANNEHMLLGARMVAGMGLSGFPFAGNDVGGFTGDASAALYRRWMACAVFHPLMRAHTMINSKHAEPWSFGEECTEVARNYIHLRYRLLPHLYSLFYESSINGMPPVRSLLFDYFDEWKIFSKPFENQFMLGDGLLVCPVEAEAMLAKVYLPKGNWYNFFNDQLYAGGQEHLVELQRDTIPVFVKAGSILPTTHEAPAYMGERNDLRLDVHVYLGGKSSYQYYEDDGLTIGGDCLLRTLAVDSHGISVSAVEGNYAGSYVGLRLYLHGFSGHSVELNGESMQVRHENFRFLAAISNFDPYEHYPDGAKLIERLAYVDLQDWRHAAKIHFSDLTNI